LEEPGDVLGEPRNVAEELRNIPERPCNVAEERGNVAERRGNPGELQNNSGEKEIKSGEQRNGLSVSRKNILSCPRNADGAEEMMAGRPGNRARSWISVAQGLETLQGLGINGMRNRLVKRDIQ
jgi:hypothetical protein